MKRYISGILLVISLFAFSTVAFATQAKKEDQNADVVVSSEHDATKAPDTQKPTTQAPTTQKPTTQEPTTQATTTQEPTTQKPTTTTQAPTTQAPTTQAPTTQQDNWNPTVDSQTETETTTEKKTTKEPETTKENKVNDSSFTDILLPLFCILVGLAIVVPGVFAIAKKLSQKNERKSIRKSPRNAPVQKTNAKYSAAQKKAAQARKTQDNVSPEKQTKKEVPMGAAATATNAVGSAAGIDISALPLFGDICDDILPVGVKGEKGLEEAYDKIDALDRAKIGRVILTPSFVPGKKNAPEKEIRFYASKIENYVKEKHPAMKLFLGNMVLYNDKTVAVLKAKRAMTLAESSYALIDFPVNTDWRDIDDTVEELVAAGFRPILAHTETLKDLDEVEEYQQLMNKGAYIAVNLSNLTGLKAGFYKKKATMLFEEELVDFIFTGSELKDGDAKKLYNIVDWMETFCSDEYMLRLLKGNFEKLLKDEEIL